MTWSPIGIVLVEEHNVALRGIEVDDVFVPPGIVCGVLDTHYLVRVDTIVLENHLGPIKGLDRFLQRLTVQVGT